MSISGICPDNSSHISPSKKNEILRRALPDEIPEVGSRREPNPGQQGCATATLPVTFYEVKKQSEEIPEY